MIIELGSASHNGLIQASGKRFISLWYIFCANHVQRSPPPPPSSYKFRDLRSAHILTAKQALGAQLVLVERDMFRNRSGICCCGRGYCWSLQCHFSVSLPMYQCHFSVSLPVYQCHFSVRHAGPHKLFCFFLHHSQ